MKQPISQNAQSWTGSSSASADTGPKSQALEKLFGAHNDNVKRLVLSPNANLFYSFLMISNILPWRQLTLTDMLRAAWSHSVFWASQRLATTKATHIALTKPLILVLRKNAFRLKRSTTLRQDSKRMMPSAGLPTAKTMQANVVGPRMTSVSSCRSCCNRQFQQTIRVAGAKLTLFPSFTMKVSQPCHASLRLLLDIDHDVCEVLRQQSSLQSLWTFLQSPKVLPSQNVTK